MRGIQIYMSGFQSFNQYGALQIDGTNKSVSTSVYLGRLGVIDVGSVVFVGGTAFGNGTALGWLTNPLPSYGTNWWRPTVNGAWAMPGSGLFTPNSGDFMNSSARNSLQSGICDVFSPSGELVWSAVSAGSMPRIQGFITVPAGQNLASMMQITSPIPNPWICISQCPGESSEAGEGTGGYSGVIIRRVNEITFQIQYINRFQKNYSQAMGGLEYKICLASFTGY